MVWKATKASGKSPLPASGHSITVRENKVYVFAGNTAKVTHSKLFILNTGQPNYRHSHIFVHQPPPPPPKKKLAGGLKTWTEGATRGQGPSDRQDHSSTMIQNNNKDHLFIFGGKDKKHNYNDVFLLNAGFSSPSSVSPLPLSLPPPRSAHRS